MPTCFMPAQGACVIMTATLPSDFLTPPQGWLDTLTPRLAVPPVRERGWLFRALSLSTRLFGRTQLPDVFPVINLQPRLFLQWLWFASRMMPYGQLPAPLRELLILRTGWNCRCRYEWGQHVAIGLDAGLTDQDIVAIAKGPEAWQLAPQQTLLLACDELCRDNRISDPVWAELSTHFAPPLLVEITLLVGHYRMLAGLLNTAGLRLESSMEDALQAFHQRLSPGLAS